MSGQQCFAARRRQRDRLSSKIFPRIINIYRTKIQNSDFLFAKSELTMLQALPGYFGQRGDAATRCMAGFYCQAGVEEPTPCPNNTQSPSGATKLTDCVSLPGYRGQPGTAAVICSANTFCPTGQDQFTNCPPNTQSPRGSTSQDACIPVGGAFGRPGERAEFCPAGFYCPPGSQSPLRCPSYTNSTLGSDQLTDCQASRRFRPLRASVPN